jgi:hypothetical protein
MTLPRRSVRLKAIGLAMLALAGAVLWLTTANDLAQGFGRAWGHMGQALLETGIALAAIRWTAQIGKLQTGIGAVAVVLYPIQGAVRGLPMDAVWVVETIVVVPALLGGIALWLSAWVRAREEA